MKRTRVIAQAGMIAAVYGALTLLTVQVLGFLAWGPVQLRVSEAATVVGMLTPAAIPGLTLGSVIANLYLFVTTGNPATVFDVVFGSLGTLVGAVWMWRWRRVTGLALLGPVVANALIVPAYLPVLLKSFGITEVPLMGISLDASWLSLYAIFAVAVAIGQAVVVYGLGLPLLIALRRIGLAERFGWRE